MREPIQDLRIEAEQTKGFIEVLLRALLVPERDYEYAILCQQATQTQQHSLQLCVIRDVLADINHGYQLEAGVQWKFFQIPGDKRKLRMPLAQEIEQRVRDINAQIGGHAPFLEYRRPKAVSAADVKRPFAFRVEAGDAQQVRERTNCRYIVVDVLFFAAVNIPNAAEAVAIASMPVSPVPSRVIAAIV